VCGQGRAVRTGGDIVGGMEGCEEGSGGGGDVVVVVVVVARPSGDVFVGPLSTNFLIRSGVFAGVT
jgi:hypothetical protein